jgi:integrase
VAQLGARLDGIEEVVGSNPIGSTNTDLKRVRAFFTVAFRPILPLPQNLGIGSKELIAMRHTKVAVYRRESGKYHRCYPHGIYPANRTTFVLRYEISRNKRTWEKLPTGTDFKTAVRAALQKELALAEAPAALPTKSVPKFTTIVGLTPIRAAVDAYIDGLWAEGNLRAKTIKGKKFELYRWVGWCDKQYLEKLTRTDMIAFRDRLIIEGKSNWTVESNITTMLKHNPLKGVTGLLKPQDWVEIADTEPAPYMLEEIHALLRVANEDECLLVRFLVGTGCRDMEVAHLRWEDIDWNQKTVWIHAKKCDCSDCKQNKGIWKPKTRAGTRTIPISDSLIRDLKARRKKEGLVFPAPEGGVDRHFYRIIEDLAAKAGVEKPGVHRFRGTWATDMLRSGVDIFTLRKWIGHEGLETLRLYADSLKAKDQRARNAANGQDKYLISDAAD